MTDSGDSPSRKGSRWLADRIAGGLDPSADGGSLAGRHLSREEIDDLISRTLDEELERLEREEEGSG